MGAGRFLCVALPLLLTIASIGSLLYATLAGVAHNNLRMFRLDVSELSIDPANLDTIGDKILGIDLRAVKTGNITAADLELGKIYDITLWGYCRTDRDNKRTCTKAKFDWATKSLDPNNLETEDGTVVVLPKEIRNALRAFRKVAKYAEIAFIVSLIALGVELLIGIFSNFSRGISCLTWLESCITTVLVFASAGLATGMAVIVVGAVDSTAKFYGVDGQLDKKFLAVIWIGAAFALAATLFWVFTICCCKPDHSRKNRGTKHRDADGEKLLPTNGGFKAGGYAPLSNEHEMTSGNYYNPSQPQSSPSLNSGARYPGGSGRADLAYEPYSHRA